MARYIADFGIDIYDEDECLILEQNARIVIEAENDSEMRLKLKEAMKNYSVNWLRSTEIHRVYETRYDCPIEPEGVRQPKARSLN